MAILRPSEFKCGWQEPGWRREPPSGHLAQRTPWDVCALAISAASYQAGVRILGFWLTKCLLRHCGIRLTSATATSQHTATEPHSYILRFSELLSCSPCPGHSSLFRLTIQNLSDLVLITPSQLPLGKSIPVSRQTVSSPWFTVIHSYHFSSSVRWVNEANPKVSIKLSL